MKDLIEKFYIAFGNLDAEQMISCYHDEIIFEDPAFGVLKGEQAKNMWRMLCKSQQGKQFQVEFSDVEYANLKGKAHWEAYYNFSRTGRKVHNKIDAEFEFQDGLIIKHTDHFNLHQWAKQALGWQGFLIGWTPFFKRKLNSQTKSLLAKFEKAN